MTTPTAEMIAKLPKWAQAEMEDLKRKADQAQQALKTLMDNATPSDCWLTNNTLDIGDRFYLPSNRVTFGLGKSEIQIWPERGRLTVMVTRSISGSLTVRPHVSNVVSIAIEE